MLFFCLAVFVCCSAAYVSSAKATDDSSSEFSTEPMVAGGWSFSIALKSNGTVWAWGNNYYGQLGDGTTNESYMPLQVDGVENITDIACGFAHSVILKKDGTVWSWGDNDQNKSKYLPFQINDLENIINIDCGAGYSVALEEDGSIWTWGDNDQGQLGDGTNESRNTPVQVKNIDNITDIACGSGHMLAKRSDGSIWGWGSNYYGSLVDNAEIAINTPIRINGIANVIAIACGGLHNLALEEDGTVWSWGYNEYGQLGNGTYENSSNPTQINNLGNIVAISCGDVISFALKEDGTVWAWGWNAYEQLGNGTNINSPIPVQVMNLDNITILGKGMYYHSLCMESNGYVWTWGNNNGGQLGDGTTTDSNVPIQINLNLYESTSPTPVTTPTSATGSVAGFITDGNTGLGIAGAIVKSNTGGYSGTTDATGYYQIDNLPEENYTFTASASEYVSETVYNVKIYAGETTGLDFALLKNTDSGELCSISGNVVNSEWYPVKGAQVRLRGINTSTSYRNATDGDGLFEFASLKSDTYAIRVFKRGYKSFRRIIELEEGESLDFEIMLRGK